MTSADSIPEIKIVKLEVLGLGKFGERVGVGDRTLLYRLPVGTSYFLVQTLLL